jgi:hypothetical protein
MRLLALLFALVVPTVHAQTEPARAQIEQVTSAPSHVKIDVEQAFGAADVTVGDVQGGTSYAWGEGNLLTLIRHAEGNVLSPSDPFELLVQGERNTISVTQQTAGNRLTLSVAGAGNSVTVVQQ